LKNIEENDFQRKHDNMSGTIEITYVSEESLQEVPTLHFIKDVGATENPTATYTSYQYKGYSGIMFVAETKNMKASEDKLLSICQECYYTIDHKTSSAEEAEGFVYLIEGNN